MGNYDRVNNKRLPSTRIYNGLKFFRERGIKIGKVGKGMLKKPFVREQLCWWLLRKYGIEMGHI